MKILSKLDSLDNIQDGDTRKLITKTTSGGSGNAVTAVSVSGDTITYTKGTNFLTSHQSAFSNVKVGSSTVAADQAGDTLELVAGSNVTLTPDTTNDKITIAATGTMTGVSVNGTSVATSGIADITSIPTNILTPMMSKTYTNIQGSGDNNSTNYAFYYMSVKPDDFNKPWSIRYRIRVWIPGKTNFDACSDAYFIGEQASINSYAVFNHFYSTSYRPVYYHGINRLKSAGYTAGYGHAFAMNMADSHERATSGYARSFTVEILSAVNCTVTLLDTPVKWASWTGTGSTNYNDITNYNFSSNGLQESGDSDTTYQLRSYYDRPLVDTNKLYGYSLCTLTSDDKLTGFVTSYSTGTSKTKNNATFKINAPIWYYGNSTEKAAGSYPGDNTLYYQTSSIDLRYSTNCGTTLTANKPVYLVGVPNGSTYTLADTWWTQTLPSSADGKIYIYLGIAYSTYQIAWQINHPIYWYKDGAVKLYIPSAGDLAYINKGSGSSKYLREDGTWQTVSSSGGTVTGVTAGTGLNTTSNDTTTDGGTISTSGTLYLTKSGVTAGTYQGLTVDKYGRVTSASNMGYTTNTGTITGVSINNTSIATSGVANIVTNSTYNSSTNKIATMSDVPSFTFTDITVNPWD